MDKFRNKYRIPSARLSNWDYGWNAPYFVTICTGNRQCFFGKIMDRKMMLSEIGALANTFWLEIPNHFPFVKLDVHAVTAAASQKWKSESLGVIINQYKRICTINARKIHADFAWQSRYHDHIIRDDESYQRIRNYIINNPWNWGKDKFKNG